jgi:hypothetical protein
MRNRFHYLPSKRPGSVCSKLQVRVAAIVAGNLSDLHFQNKNSLNFFDFESLHGTYICNYA